MVAGPVIVLALYIAPHDRGAETMSAQNLGRSAGTDRGSPAWADERPPYRPDPGRARSQRFELVMGSVLNTINQGDAILNGGR